MIKMFTATDHTVRLGYQKVKSLGGEGKNQETPDNQVNQENHENHKNHEN